MQTKLNNAKGAANAASGKDNMRAIFIDAVNQKVEEVQVENELHAFYEKIGCDMIEIIHIGGEHLMVVDEEGRLRNWAVGFRLPKSEGIAGNALVIRDNGDGDFTDSNLPVELFEIAVQFLNLKKAPFTAPGLRLCCCHRPFAGGDCQSPSGGPERP